MTLLLVLLLLLLAFGLGLRAWGEMVEARQLRLTAALLRTDGDDSGALEPSVIGTVLERTRVVLSTAKLARIISLIFIIPAAYFFALEAKTIVLAKANGAWLGGTLILFMVLILFVLYLFAFLVGALAAKGEDEDSVPDWLINSESHAPPVLVAGFMVWEKVVEPIDRFMARLGSGRPQAQLYEQEREIRLAVVGHHAPDSAVAKNGKRKPVVERSEADMVEAIQQLDRTLVREIMRPINHVTAIRLKDYTPEGFLELCRRTGFTRIPVYENQVTDLIGFINIYDLLDADELPGDLKDVVSTPLFVPEVARGDQVLQQMIQNKQQIAIVFDEFGGTSGILSREDIIEEIVGDVGDEYERPRRLVYESRNGYLVDPSLDLDDLDREIGLELAKRNCDTIAGYIYNRLGRVPRRGESIEEKGWTIRVVSMDGHRIRRIRIMPPADEAAAE